MVAEAPDQHHGGPGRIVDGRNGLTGPNIAMHSRDLKGTNSTYCFGELKEGLWSILRMLKFVKQLTDFQYHRVSFAKCTQLERSPGS